MIFLRAYDLVMSSGLSHYWRGALVPTNQISSIAPAGYGNADAVALNLIDENHTRVLFTKPVDFGRYDIRAYTAALIAAIRGACDWSIIRGYADNSEEWDIVVEGE